MAKTVENTVTPELSKKQQRRLSKLCRRGKKLTTGINVKERIQLGPIPIKMRTNIRWTTGGLVLEPVELIAKVDPEYGPVLDGLQRTKALISFFPRTEKVAFKMARRAKKLTEKAVKFSNKHNVPVPVFAVGTETKKAAKTSNATAAKKSR